MDDGNIDIVFIRDLELFMSIGIHAQEKKNKQRVLVNVQVYMSPVAYDDKIENTFCYETLVDFIAHLANAKHYNLVETFAQEIADYILSRPEHTVQKTSVEVAKPDIIDAASAVGVRIVRQSIRGYSK